MLGGGERKEEEAETTAKEFASHLVLGVFILADGVHLAVPGHQAGGSAGHGNC